LKAESSQIYRFYDKSFEGEYMKITTRSDIYLLMAAMILTAALATPAAAQKQIPFKGTFQGTDTTNETATPPTIASAATGTGTHLGQFSLTQDLTLNFGNFTDTGSAQWIAANGDILYTTVAGSAIPGNVVFTITEIHTVTGGTGRFTGAQGSFTVHRTHVVALSDDGTHVTSGWFEGTITSPGAAH
jgi:hypothetical protein